MYTHKTITVIKIMTIFISPESCHINFQPQYLFPSLGKLDLLCLVRSACTLCFMSGVILHVLFFSLIASTHTLHDLFEVHPGCWVWCLFFSVAKMFFIVWLYHSLLICSLVDGHWHCLLFFGIIKKAWIFMIKHLSRFMEAKLTKL